MRVFALVLCAAALVVGCGDDDDPAVETTTVTTTETVTTTAPEPVETTPEEPGDGGSGGAEAPPASGHGGAEAGPTSKCGRIAFNPSTDSGASGITAVGTDCQTAHAVARAARNATDELSYEAEGFRCAGARSSDAGLSSIEWFCVGADREVVSFVTT